MADAVLHELLSIGLRYAPEYQGGLSNHLPMALAALHGLGAGEDRLREYFDRYATRLALAPRGGRPLADWRERLGRVEAWPDLVATFDRHIADRGVEATLADALPVLMEGAGAAAFHGLIRTAYAVEAGHGGETAAGLAYWACRHLPLPAPAAGRQHDPAAWLAALLEALSDRRIEGGLIFERMREVGRTAAFERLGGALAVDEGTLRTLADLAARHYVATRNFTVLHLLTSCHALRLLLPHLPDPTVALQAYARAYAAGVVASGIVLDRPLPAPVPADWARVARRAIDADDDHVIKLAYSCREEARAWGDGEAGLRLQAAALAVGG